MIRRRSALHSTPPSQGLRAFEQLSRNHLKHPRADFIQCFGGNPCNRCTKRRFLCEFSTAVRQRGPNKPQTVGGSGTNTGSTSTTPTMPSASSATTVSKPGPITGKPGRRHSLPEQPGAAPSFATGLPPGPQKGYSSTDIHQIGDNGDTTPVAYSVPSSTVIPHLPTPVGAEYLSVPGHPGQHPHSSAPSGSSRPHSDSTYYHSTELRSPVFAFTPDSSEPATDEYPYTPISPATNFSPQLGMTSAVHGQYAPRQPPAQDRQATNDSNVWYSTSTN